jgi:DNA polymerase-1
MVRAVASAWTWRSLKVRMGTVSYAGGWLATTPICRTYPEAVLLEASTRTLTGRRRTKDERLIDRLNAPVQGTAADGLKLALALPWERTGECLGAVPVLVCHDEIVIECDADKAEEAKEWLVQVMKDGMDAVVNVMEPHIPIEVEASVSKTWGG